MLYYSDKTRKFYETMEDCERAEREFQAEQEQKEKLALQKSNARKEAAKKVSDAYEAMAAAKKAYQKELSDFCKEYGTYHFTVGKDGILDWMDTFWDRWF